MHKRIRKWSKLFKVYRITRIFRSEINLEKFFHVPKFVQEGIPACIGYKLRSKRMEDKDMHFSSFFSKTSIYNNVSSRDDVISTRWQEEEEGETLT